jgi:hypothetical protein
MRFVTTPVIAGTACRRPRFATVTAKKESHNKGFFIAFSGHYCYLFSPMTNTQI